MSTPSSFVKIRKKCSFSYSKAVVKKTSKWQATAKGRWDQGSCHRHTCRSIIWRKASLSAMDAHCNRRWQLKSHKSPSGPKTLTWGGPDSLLPLCSEDGCVCVCSVCVCVVMPGSVKSSPMTEVRRRLSIVLNSTVDCNVSKSIICVGGTKVESYRVEAQGCSACVKDWQPVAANKQSSLK